MTKKLTLTPLSRITHPKGDILHGLKNTDETYKGFGELYFSLILRNEVKGWKRHKHMTMNLIVLVGNVRFYHYDAQTEKTNIIEIGNSNYARLTVPPGNWLAFEGLEFGENIILNFANILHDPLEAESMPLDCFPLMSP